MSDRPPAYSDAFGDPQSPHPRLPPQAYGQYQVPTQHQYQPPTPQMWQPPPHYVPPHQYYNMPPPRQPYFMGLLDSCNATDLVGSSTFVNSEESLQHESGSNKRSSSQSRETDVDVVSPSKKKGKRLGGRNQWTPQHDECLIHYLADQARQGCKPDKQFKMTTFTQAAEHVNARCGTCFSGEMIKNHARTLRSRYQLMMQAINLSGAGWDETTKTVTMSSATYETWSLDKKNAKLLPYVNTPLLHLEELKVIVGDDDARGEFRRSVFGSRLSSHSVESSPIDVDDDAPIDLTEQESQSKSKSHPPPVPKRSTKGKTKKDAILAEGNEIASSLDRMTTAMYEMDWIQKLQNRMQVLSSSFDPRLIEEAMDFFMSNDREGRRFAARPKQDQEDWLRRFGREHGFEDDN